MKTIPAIGVDEVIRAELNEPLMLYMLKHFANIVDDEFITINDDVILNGNIDEITNDDKDISICKRTKPRIDQNGNDFAKIYPYSNGFVVVRNKDFYRDCYSRLKDMPDLWNWWGDMAAIRDAIDSGKYTTRFLDEKDFCRIPGRMGQGDATSILWHYAGNIRKEWIQYHGTGEVQKAE